jgi:hypothetical protein
MQGLQGLYLGILRRRVRRVRRALHLWRAGARHQARARRRMRVACEVVVVRCVQGGYFNRWWTEATRARAARRMLAALRPAWGRWLFAPLTDFSQASLELQVG